MNAPSEWPLRTAYVERRTNETDIAVRVTIDGTGRTDLASGIAFLDHMLDQVGRHALFDLAVTAKGRPAHRRASHGRGHRYRRSARR
jgi:imidazoleglycerol phosphate dehydratase HisB